MGFVKHGLFTIVVPDFRFFFFYCNYRKHKLNVCRPFTMFQAKKQIVVSGFDDMTKMAVYHKRIWFWEIVGRGLQHGTYQKRKKPKSSIARC